MASNKKPRKKYRPREVRTPSLVYRVTPQMTEKDHRDIDLMPYVHLDNIRRGNGTITDVVFVQSSIRACFVLAAAFENSAEIRRLCRLAAGSMYAIDKLLAKDIAKGKKDGERLIEDFLLEPPQMCLDTHGEMTRSCSRDVLVRAARAGYDAVKPLLKIEPGRGFVVEPDWDPDDETTKAIEGRPATALINGTLRCGHVHMNHEMKRTEFVVPDEKVTVPILRTVTVLLDKPVSEKLQKKLASYGGDDANETHDR